MSLRYQRVKTSFSSLVYAIPALQCPSQIFVHFHNFVERSTTNLNLVYFFLLKRFFFVAIHWVMTCFIFRHVYMGFEVFTAVAINILLVTVKGNRVSFQERQ